MKIFMIIYDKAPNTSNGTMGYASFVIGNDYPIPTQGILTLKSIDEGVGINKKPVVTLRFDGGVEIEMPDYNIEKYRTDGQERRKTTNKTG